MTICIAGWYYRPSFLNMVRASDYPAFVIQHRDGPTCGIPAALYPNAGLEFGAYRQYVEHHWDGESDVLFLHDDVELASPDGLDDVRRLRAMGVEQAYIFHDENEEFVNGGAHGRGIWIRGDILRKLAADFPADMANTGVTVGKEAQLGIFAFHRRILECGKNTAAIAIVPQFRFGHRGRIHDAMFVYRKTHGPLPGGLVHVAQ